jgi:maleylpyruvate isomerase
MTTTRQDNWTVSGTSTFLRLVDDLADSDLAKQSLLPGWDRRRLIAHVAANAEGLGRLVSWARTGEVTPMYASADERAAAIDRGAQLPNLALRLWVKRTATELNAALDALSPHELQAEVVTSQGRTIPASELSWLRAREVTVHAVDLAAGFTFDDLDQAFTRALITDIARLRDSRADGPPLRLQATDTGNSWRIHGTGQAALVSLPLARLSGWLTGRESPPHLPSLPAWL